MTEPVLCACAAETRDDALVCDDCLRWFRKQLEALPGLLAELDVTTARLASAGRSEGRKTKASSLPLPFNPDSSDLAALIRFTLMRGVLIVARDEGDLSREGMRDTSAETSVKYLLQHMEWFRFNEHGPEVIAWVKQQTAKIRNLIEPPGPRMYAGQCGATIVHDDLELGYCQAQLFAAIDRSKVQCKDCKAVHAVADRRERIIDEAWEKLLPFNTIYAALPFLAEVKINRTTARAWRHDRQYRAASKKRGARPFRTRQLHHHGINSDGVELYQVGEVIDLAKATAERSARRAESARIA